MFLFDRRLDAGFHLSQQFMCGGREGDIEKADADFYFAPYHALPVGTGHGFIVSNGLHLRIEDDVSDPFAFDLNEFDVAGIIRCLFIRGKLLDDDRPLIGNGIDLAFGDQELPKRRKDEPQDDDDEQEQDRRSKQLKARAWLQGKWTAVVERHHVGKDEIDKAAEDQSNRLTNQVLRMAWSGSGVPTQRIVSCPDRAFCTSL